MDKRRPLPYQSTRSTETIIDASVTAAFTETQKVTHYTTFVSTAKQQDIRGKTADAQFRKLIEFKLWCLHYDKYDFYGFDNVRKALRVFSQNKKFIRDINTIYNILQVN